MPVNSKTQLTNVEKLAYLGHALKDVPVVEAIEGLSRSADQYEEATGCLIISYDRPCLIHRVYVCAILDAPTVKEGNGKDLRHLYDVAKQHLRALAAMNQGITESLITAMLELSLDQALMFEWPKHSQDTNDVPHHSPLLEFLELRAQASENDVCESDHKRQTRAAEKKCYPQTQSYTVNVDDWCMVCKLGSHSLYACKKFRRLPHEQMVTILKQHEFCLNCFKPGHLLKQCPSVHRCRKCQRPHHSWLHLDKEANPQRQTNASPSTSENTPGNVTPYMSQSSDSCRRVLLMTCQVQVIP